MSKYAHGDWYCMPESEAEAREIIKRAVTSGACNKSQWNGDGLKQYCYGVVGGLVYYGSADEWTDSTKYTIEQLREKFHLPCEQAGPVWTGEGRPPVGWHGEVFWEKNGLWYECVILTNGSIAYTANGNFWNTDNGHAERFDFRPIRTERDKWVDAAINAAGGKQAVINAEGIFGKIYDAIKSGDLKAPEVE